MYSQEFSVLAIMYSSILNVQLFLNQLLSNQICYSIANQTIKHEKVNRALDLHPLAGFRSTVAQFKLACTLEREQASNISAVDNVFGQKTHGDHGY